MVYLNIHQIQKNSLAISNIDSTDTMIFNLQQMLTKRSLAEEKCKYLNTSALIYLTPYCDRL